ncbi:MAG: DUF447 family protein [Halobacteriales archaeon]|nr:DUF447 family protein [Halobacteriales archaeon]
MTADWPVALRGLTESVVATPGPDGRWAVAALGLEPGEPVTARTWGRTRTRRNLERAGRGVVQFTRDPVTFVEAALGVESTDEPVLESADAWAEVSTERLETGTDAGTEWVDWALRPVEAGVEREAVATIERGFNAVIEATVDASRLGVAGYDAATLRDRLARHRAVVDRCGSERDRRAMARLDELIGE